MSGFSLPAGASLLGELVKDIKDTFGIGESSPPTPEAVEPAPEVADPAETASPDTSYAAAGNSGTLADIDTPTTHSIVGALWSAGHSASRAETPTEIPQNMPTNAPGKGAGIPTEVPQNMPTNAPKKGPGTPTEVPKNSNNTPTERAGAPSDTIRTPTNSDTDRVSGPATDPSPEPNFDPKPAIPSSPPNDTIPAGEPEQGVPPKHADFPPGIEGEPDLNIPKAPSLPTFYSTSVAAAATYWDGMSTGSKIGLGIGAGLTALAAAPVLIPTIVGGTALYGSSAIFAGLIPTDMLDDPMGHGDDTA